MSAIEVAVALYTTAGLQRMAVMAGPFPPVLAQPGKANSETADRRQKSATLRNSALRSGQRAARVLGEWLEASPWTQNRGERVNMGCAPRMALCHGDSLAGDHKDAGQGKWRTHQRVAKASSVLGRASLSCCLPFNPAVVTATLALVLPPQLNLTRPLLRLPCQPSLGYFPFGATATQLSGFAEWDQKQTEQMASAFRRISQSISGCSGLAEADKRRPSIHGQALECECRCDCPGCPCLKARKEAVFRREEDLSDYVIVDRFGECSNASSEDETIRLGIEGIGVCPIAPQIEREAPFPWRIDLGERGWTGSAADGFSNDDHGRAEMLHYSDILRDLAEIDRTGTPDSLANEAASMGAMSMTKSGFLRRRSLTPAESNVQPYSHMGAWNDGAPPQAYLFSRQPPPSATTSGLSEECTTGGGWDERAEYSQYPRFIRDEDLA